MTSFMGYQGAEGKEPKEWLKECQFYLFGIPFVLAKLTWLTNATMMPFYLKLVLDFQPTDSESASPVIALVPLIGLFSSFVFTMYCQAAVTEKFKSRLATQLLSLLALVVGGGPLLFITVEQRWAIYASAPVTGVGFALLMNTSLTLCSDVIGKDTKGSAFVYGVYFFVEKLITGFVVFYLVANFTSPDDTEVIKMVVIFLPIVCALLSILVTYLGTRLFSKRLQQMSFHVKKEGPSSTTQIN